MVRGHTGACEPRTQSAGVSSVHVSTPMACLRAAMIMSRLLGHGVKLHVQTLQGSTCLGPLLHYGAHMFKVSYRPGPWHDAAAATAAAVPAESTDYPGSSRRRLALHGPEQLRSTQEQLQAQRQAQQQQEQASGIAGDADSSTMPLAEKVIMKVCLTCGCVVT